MSTVDSRGNIHSGAGAPGAGRFTGKANARQPNTLDPAAWPVDGQPDDVTGLREEYGPKLRSDADLARAIAVMEKQGIDFRRYSPDASQIASLVKDAIVEERWRDTPKSGDLNEFTVNDVTVMGGDEIRSMTPQQRRHLLAQAVQAACRLQEYLVELEEEPAESTAHLEVVDFRNLTERNVTDVWAAAREQLGARGVIRTREDFLSQAEDHGCVLTQDGAEQAWQHYLTNHADDHEEAIAAGGELDRFTAHVVDSVRATA